MPWYRTPSKPIRIVAIQERPASRVVGPAEMRIRFSNNQTLITGRGFIEHQTMVREWVETTFGTQLDPPAMSDRRL